MARLLTIEAVAILSNVVMEGLTEMKKHLEKEKE